MIAELIVGYISGSLALVSDGVHMGSHFFALACVYLTVGKGKLEACAAGFNGICLAVLSFFIFYSALDRFFAPKEIKLGLMMVVAVMGLLVNFWQIRILYPADRNYLGMKSAFFHVLSDTLVSVGVIFGGVLVYLTGWYAIDALFGGIISFVILRYSYLLITDSLRVLKKR